LPTVAASIGTVDMSLFAILLFVGTMVLSLRATMRVRQVYGKFSQLPTSSGLSGTETAATILRQERISNVEIAEHDDGGREGIARSGLDLRCRVHYIAWLLPLHLLPLIVGRKE
jgi:hypothetical protein